MKKGISEKIWRRLFKICKYALFDKEDKEKNWAIYFEISKYTFFSIWKKGTSEEIGLAFFNIWKRGYAKKLSYIFLWFASILFLVF